MRISLLFLVLACLSTASSQSFSNSIFTQLSETEFKAVSYFNHSTNNCFQSQIRKETVFNDTLFLAIVFDMRVATVANGCSRVDTIQQTNFSSSINFINVSTGRITWNQQDPNIADTIWSLYDSTFAATLQIPENPAQTPVFSVNEGQLTVHNESVTGIRLIDLNGKQLQISSNNILDISQLQSGVYLLQIFSGAGNVTVVRWMKE